MRRYEDSATAGLDGARGYSNGILAEMTVGSKLVFVGGQVGWNGQQQFESDDLADQVRQTLANIVAILAEGGASRSTSCA